MGWLLLGWLLLGWLLLIFSLNKTPLGETGCLSNSYFLLTGSSGIQFFDSPPFPTQSVMLPLVTYPSLCSTCVTYRTLCHAIGHQVLPTQPLPREVEDFPRSDKHFKHVPPPTSKLAVKQNTSSIVEGLACVFMASILVVVKIRVL